MISLNKNRIIDTELLFKEHYSSLCKKAYRIINNQHLAEDLVQDVFVKLWKNRKQTHIQKDIKSYLGKMVFNECISYLRKNKIERYNDADFFNNYEDLPNQTELSEDALKEIHIAINTLPAKCKAIFMMSKFENMTYQQIADELEISIKTVENHMSKAFKTLRVHIKSKQVLFMLYFKG